MQTIYYQTSSFIRHEGNVVDLGAYRRKLSAVSGGDWEDVPVQEPAPTQPEAAVPLLRLVPPESPKVRAARRHRGNDDERRQKRRQRKFPKNFHVLPSFAAEFFRV